ncbi:alpha/beta hydrolase [Lapidilactobacillus bayanensis]|uniref:alpha/beta hydrolase n=1 Tax=Lapidilactobacillus bayanensis TaxID=2485998 RepID=UPI00384DEE0C
MIHQYLKTSLSDDATLTGYIIDNSPEIDADKTRPAVVICPGGGYAFVSAREAEPVAIQMVARGFQAFVLHYSVAPARFPTQLLELAESVKIVRQHAAEWHIDPEQIIAAGFSAGGHIAAGLGTLWHGELLKKYGYDAQEIQPNGLLLSYAVLTSGQFAHRGSMVNLLGADFKDDNKRACQSLENQVDEYTPKAFMWTTFTDHAVSMENTLMFAEALRRHNINFELHVFPAGSHGLSLGNEESQKKGNLDNIQPEVQVWPDLFTTWVKNQIEK